MTGVQIQYLLGLFFALHTVRFESGGIKFDWAQVIIGVILVAAAVLGATLLK